MPVDDPYLALQGAAALRSRSDAFRSAVGLVRTDAVSAVCYPKTSGA
jgi:hypothetical protein